MHLKKRIPLYLLGVIVMAFGVVLISKANLGVSPLSAIPFAVSAISGAPFGTMTTAFHVLCVLLQALLLRKITLKLLLQLPLATVFGLVVNLFGGLLPWSPASIPLCLLLNLGGTLCSALGIVLIVRMDLMLPPPDALLRVCSQLFRQPLSRVKIIGDVAFVAIAFCIEWIASGRITAVGLGTLLSMLLTGRFVGLLGSYLPLTGAEPQPARDNPADGEEA